MSEQQKRDPRERNDGPPLWSLGIVGLGLMLVLGFLLYAWNVGADGIEAAGAAVGGAGVALVAAWLWLERESLRQVSATRGGQFTAMAILLTILAAGVAVALNVVASRYDKQWDLTSTSRYTLAEQSIKAAEGLQQDVEVLAFFAMGSPDETDFRSLMDLYAEHTDRLKVTFIDPLSDPIQAKQHNISSQSAEMGDTAVILKVGEATQRLTSSFDQEAFTNALIRLATDRQHVVCFSEGHGEYDVEDTYTETGLGTAAARLEKLNYTKKKVFLAREGRVPADCAVLVVANPLNDWLPQERELLAAFLAGGGKALLMLEVGQTPELAKDLARYGIAVGEDLLVEGRVENQMAGFDPSYIILDPSSFDFHPITSAGKTVALMRFARSVGKGAEIAGINVQELAKTSQSSWAESDLVNLTAIAPDPGKDRMGPVPLMVSAEITDPAVITISAAPAAAPGVPALAPPGATPPAPEGAPDAANPGAAAPTEAPVENGTPAENQTPPENGTPAAPAAPATPAAPEAAAGTPAPAEPAAPPAPAAPAPAVERKPGGRIVVIGDADFASNILLDEYNNLDLVLNSLAWLVGEEDQISIRPNEAAEGALSMSALQLIAVVFLTLIVAPGMTLLGAALTWRARRRL